MAVHNETGKLGETLAEQFLVGKGLNVLEKNWRHKKWEIDLIAKEKEVLVFVEVKTRSSDFLGPPEIYVDEAKEKNLTAAAAAYMAQINHDWAIRFDVVSVVLKNKKDCKITHIKDAFFPGL